MKNILVIGGNGFLGSELTLELKRNNYNVLNECFTDNRSKKRLDIFQPEEIGNVTYENSVEAVYILAWFTKHGEFWNSSENYRYANAIKKLIRTLADRGVKQIIGIGSMSEYWDKQGACDGMKMIAKPNSIYGQAKLEVAKNLYEATLEFDLKGNWARVFQAFGSGEDNRRLIPSLVAAANRREKIKINNPHDNLDWIHKTEIARALVWSLQSELDFYVDIGTGNAKTVYEVAQDIYRIAKTPTKLIEISHQNEYDARNLYVSRQSQLFRSGWRESREVTTYLKEYVEMDRNR